MFERYNEAAKKSVFTARYEASQFGSPYIEPEHLLLGILRADASLAAQLLGSPDSAESIRGEFEKSGAKRKKIEISVDLPLSHESKRVLAWANEESELMSHKHIGPEHLLLGILRAGKCRAAESLSARGITADRLREAARRRSGAAAPPRPHADIRDLTAAARNGALGPFIGREHELERVLQVLSRRTRRNPALIGEPGVGKTAIVEGLAQRIAHGEAPLSLADRPVFAVDAGLLIGPRRAGSPLEIPDMANAILCIEGLFDMAGTGSEWTLIEALRILEPHLAAGMQCVATGTPLGFRRTMEKAGGLARHFEVVAVPPPTEAETLEILRGIRAQYERFHDVTIGDETIETAIRISRRFLKHRELPDRAIDLLDEACARAQVRRRGGSAEEIEIRRRIRQITREMENAIATHDFPGARRYEEQERQEREQLQRVIQQNAEAEAARAITPAHIEEAAADRCGMQVTVLRRLLQENADEWERISNELSAHAPAAAGEWTRSLADHLAASSPEEADRLAEAIRRAKGLR